MTTLQLFERLETTALGVAIRDSAWLFPVIESFHLLGLATLGGAVLVVDLKLFGLGLKNRSADYVLGQTQPWLLGAIATMLATGIPLFLSEAVKLYFAPAFRTKMCFLGIALLFTFMVRNPAIRRYKNTPPLAKLVAATSIALWLIVAGSGRWIGFS